MMMMLAVMMMVREVGDRYLSSVVMCTRRLVLICFRRGVSPLCLNYRSRVQLIFFGGDERRGERKEIRE